MIARPGCPERNPALVLTYPIEWLSRYIDQNYFVVDPVLSTGASSHLPFDWSSLDKRGPRARQLFGESIDFGIGTQGMTFPVRGAVGDFALFSVTGETTLAAWQVHMRHFSRDLLMLAHLIHARMMGLVVPSDTISTMSPREREVLTLGARGHTNKQIAYQLSISERAIRAYFESARMKLNCANRGHVLARAVDLRIISSLN